MPVRGFHGSMSTKGTLQMKEAAALLMKKA